MVSRLLVVLAVLLAGPPAADAEPPRTPDSFNDEGIAWQTFEDGLAEARRSGKPIFLLVHATWCPVCRVYRAQFFDKQVEEMARRMVFVIVDGDLEPDLSDRYALDGTYIPRSMILDPEGRPVEAISGPDPEYRYFLYPASPEELRSMLAQGLARAQ